VSESQPAGETDKQFDALVRTVVTASTDLGEALTTVAEMGRTGIDGCVAASLTLIEGGRPTTVASTDGVAPTLDQVQYDAGTGPCLEAVRTKTTVRIASLATEDRWADFGDAATALGIHSSLSVPLPLPEGTDGGLNLYGEETGAFDEDDERLGALFASYAAAVIANVAAYRSAQELAEHLQKAMESRSAIEQAKGILMARQHCTADDAFDILRRASQRENRKLRDIAEEMVRRAQQGG
jgi:GAF domain-containing protein